MDVGNKMLLAMGWVPGEPLGIRGKGILDPVEIEFRHDRDYRGLGFEELKAEDDEEVKDVSIRIKTVGDRYGMGVSDYGRVFIPNGCLNHIAKLSGLYGGCMYVRRYLPGMYFNASITQAQGKFQYRVGTIENLVGYMYHQALTFKWIKSM